jgi:prevent-host-death family protein
MTVTQRITPTEAKRNLATVLSKVEFGHQSIIVRRHGRDIAALVPMELYELTRKLLRGLEDEEDWKAMQAALADPENAVPLDWDRSRYGNKVSNQNSAQRRQATASRARGATPKAARRHR